MTTGIRSSKGLWAVVFLSGASLLAQPGTYLKTLTTESRGGGVGASAGIKRQNPDRGHLLLVYPAPPGKAEVSQLAALDVQVVQFVPERGLIVSIADLSAIQDLRLEWVGQLRPEQKVSPALVDSGLLSAPAGDATEQLLLVEFYSDVSRGGMLSIIANEGLQTRDNPDLVSWQLLVRGSASRLARLAEWDEVAYLFPVSRELADGRPVEACAGALSTAGRIGQIVAKVSEGWDGVGRNAADAGYYFSSYTGRLSPEQVRGEVLRAMQEWARQVKVTFTAAPAAASMRTINILFGASDHGDGYPFDGPGRTLAHTFYPAPPNPEPIAGDMHLDDDEPWQLGTNIDLYSVVLHELGHTLGLGHSDNPEAVMYPYYRRVSVLHSEDINTIRELYATQDGTPAIPPAGAALQLVIADSSSASTQKDQIAVSGTTTGGTASGQVSWANNRGGSGTAQGWRPFRVDSIPLQTGGNVITFTAVDSAQGRVTQQIRVTRESPVVAALQLSIAQPVPATQADQIALSGTTSGGTLSGQVSWANNRGGSGTAQGWRPFSIASVALQTGENLITLTAVDSAQGRAAQEIRITRESSSQPLSLRILSPVSTGVFYTSSQPLITLSGSAGPAARVSRIQWVSDRGSGGSVAGSANWTTSPIPLDPGLNRITVTASDSQGQMVSATLEVQYALASDTVAPTLTVLFPALSTLSVSQPAITLIGSASDNEAVREVDWISTGNRAGKATGTISWRIVDYPLLQGVNSIMIRAYDAAGNMSWRSLSITRQ
ncbi:MAG TPA: matrixin family metalloprotease [Bryobacteraceae bacterium]|nr:matrixin family metalloprotease [Bryobacteraceae bacterium]